jgi:hypothetical protein
MKTAQFLHFARYHVDNAGGSPVVRLIWSNKNYAQSFSDNASINIIFVDLCADWRMNL